MNTSFNGQHPGNNEHTQQRFGPADPKSFFPRDLHNPSQVDWNHAPKGMDLNTYRMILLDHMDLLPYDDDRGFARRSRKKSLIHKLAQFFTSKQKTTNAHKKDAQIMSDDQISQVITITGSTSASFEGGHTVNQQGLGGMNFNAFNDNSGDAGN